MKAYVFDGTVQEIIEAVKGMQASSVEELSEPLPIVAPPIVGEATDHEFISFDIARRMLSRRPLSKEQLAVLRLLYKAYPGQVAAAELQAVTSYSRAQLAGLMGAFGRRLTHTEGYVDGTWLFDGEWDYEAKAYTYRLPEALKTAIEAEELF